MTDTEKATLILQALSQAQFTGAQRHTVNELFDWLEAIRDAKIITTPAAD